jgi:hypothetical protein
MNIQTLTTTTPTSLEPLRSMGSVRRGNMIAVNKGTEKIKAGGIT